MTDDRLETDEALNRDIDSLSISQNSSGSSEPNAASATFDKIVASTKGTISNAFGIFDVKQVAREVTSDTTSIASVAEVAKVDINKLTSLSTKTGKSILSDVDLEDATAEAMGHISNMKQAQFSGFGSTLTGMKAIGEELYSVGLGSLPSVDVSVMAAKIGKDVYSVGLGSLSDLGDTISDIGPLKSIMDTIENFDPIGDISAFIPSTLPLGEFDTLKSLYNKSLGTFNDCPNLMGILDWLSKLLDPKALFDALRKLFGMVSQFDISGLINCFKRMFAQASMLQRMELQDVLLRNGTVNGLHDIASIGNKSGFLNKYDAVRRLGRNRSVRSNQHGYIYNSWRNAEVKSKTNDIFTGLGVTSGLVFATKTLDNVKNDSIDKRIEEPVHDLASIQSTNKDNGFTEYVLGSDNDKLLRNIPSNTNSDSSVWI